MKTIGFIGGMSWESSLEYYRIANEEVKARLGGFHSAQCLMYSVDFHEIEEMQHQGRWDAAAAILVEAAQKVERGGAEFLAICTNTMHKVAPEIEKAIRIPMLHIADATAEVLVKDGVKKVGLLGTKFTMEHDFYKGRLSKKYDLGVIVPNPKDRETIHDIIYQELCLGKIKDKSKEKYLRIIDKLTNGGAEAVILGCTEIGMLVSQSDTKVKLFDTTAIHAEKAVEYAI